MNREATDALQSLTGKTSLEEVAVEELQQLASSYPYFSAIHLLLCKKMQAEEHSGLQQQLYKTALYFPDEQWLRYLLLKTKRETLAPQPEAGINTESAGDIESGRVEETEDRETGEPEEQVLPIAAEENADLVTETGEEKENSFTEDNNLITLPAETILEEVPSLANVKDEPEEAPLDEEELAQQTTEPLPAETSSQKIASLLSGQAEAFHQAVEPNQPLPIETEPYHTVDYFASQGIRLEAKKEETGLDKKVHKFTDWLRQMKRINPHPVDLGTGAEEESHIAHIAASSNQTREVITESMAEVLAKQGKYEKAVEIYEKLSLLDPSKNAYFAAKIQQIKP